VLSSAGALVRLKLHVGDRVRVKNPNEILATLDAKGRLDGLPFMPEMIAFCGRIFTVDAVAHRTCDTIKVGDTGGTTRRMERAVHLEAVRCDGSGHGGCQARCLIFWKEDWLEKVAPTDTQARRTSPSPVSHVPNALEVATRREGSSEVKPAYVCQATELSDATSFVSAHTPQMWINDVRSGNATIRAALAGIAILALAKLRRATARLPRSLRVRSRRLWPELKPTGEMREYPPLNLQPGELVEVRSQQEIEATLDPDNRRGPHFHSGMLLDCGTRARVVGRVDRIIDERTGRMLNLRGDCVVLEGVWCEGNHQALCRRKIYSFWREAWLRRVENKGCSDARAGDDWGAV
jgi:hypothetical protein